MGGGGALSDVCWMRTSKRGPRANIDNGVLTKFEAEDELKGGVHT